MEDIGHLVSVAELNTDKKSYEFFKDKLKSKNGWNKNGYDTDEFRFSALPGDHGGSDDASNYGNWWSSTEYGSNYAYYRYMSHYMKYTYWDSYVKSYLFSVRCVKD